MATKTVIEELIIEIGADDKKLKAVVKRIKRDNKDLETSYKKMGKVAAGAFLAVGAAAVTLGTVATKAFAEFETGVTNVAKTTNLAGKDLEDFKDEIFKMSETIPVGTSKLLEIATAAGQLGIKGVANLTSFTKVIAELGATTNVSGEEAAISLARILNLTNENIESAENFASSLVALGNDLELGEAELLAMASELAKTTVQFRLSSQEVLGLAGSMTSLGIQAESGATVIQKTFSQIANIINSKSGPAFERLQELTKLSGDQLEETFATNSIEVFRKFIGGLQEASKEGRFLKTELNELGLSGIRVEKVLPTLALNFDQVTKSLDLSSESYKQNTALQDEATKAFDTNASKWQIAQNKISNTLIELGADIAPEVTKAITSISDAVRENKEAIAILGSAISGVIKIIAGALGLVGKLLSTINSARKSIIAGIDERAAASIKSMAETSAAEKKAGKVNEKFTNKWIENGKARLALMKKNSKAGKKFTDTWVKNAKKIIVSEKKTAKELKKRENEEKILEKQKEASDKRLAIIEAENMRKVEIQLEADDAMFEQLQEETDNAVEEHERRNARILAEEEKANQKILDVELDEFEKEFDALEDSNAKKLTEKKRANKEELEAELDEFEKEFDALEDSHADKIEQERIFRENFAFLTDEARKEFSDEEKKALNEELKRKKEQEEQKLKFIKVRFTEEEKLLEKFQGDLLGRETIFGQSMVELKEIQGTAEFKATKTAADSLAILINSENDNLKAIGKAATIVQIGISTAEGALKAFTSLAWIPFVGPVLGGIAAAALVAFGAEQISKVSGMKEGGIVPGTGRGDKVPAMLEPGELVVPRDVAAEILKRHNARKMADGGVVGAQESEDLSKTFAGIFSVPGVFLSLIGLGGSSGGSAGGFGASAFTGMIAGMLPAIGEAADEMLRLFLEQLPGGKVLYEIYKKTGRISEDVLSLIDTSVATATSVASTVVDAAGGLLGTGSDLIGGVVSGLGFKNGGIVPGVGTGDIIPALLEPGELVIPKSFISSISGSAGGGASGGVEKIIVGFDIGIQDDLVDFITVKQREKEILGT